jgi:hypothetical protein
MDLVAAHNLADISASHNENPPRAAKILAARNEEIAQQILRIKIQQVFVFI